MKYEEAKHYFECGDHWSIEQMRAIFDEIERRAEEHVLKTSVEFPQRIMHALDEVRAELGIPK